MNFLKILFKGDGRFYDLLEASANEARQSAQILGALMPNIGNEQAERATVDKLSQSRRTHKGIAKEITKELCNTFITPLEREDIEALSNALARVTKATEKIGELLLICPVPSQNTAKHVAMLEQAAALVDTMVKSLRNRPHVDDIEKEYTQLQALEGDADRFMGMLLRELFLSDTDARNTVFLKDIYELLEKAIDRCRDAGNVIFQIVLKYS